MSSFISTRLSIMMFIQYFIWGSWFVTAYPVLSKYGFGGDDIKWTYSVGPIAAIISPVFVGMVADRWFPAQKVLAGLHLIGGLAFVGVVTVMQSSYLSPTTVNLFIALHMLCYMPTLALTNAIVLANVANPEAGYPYIRFFSGIGWIAAGITISALSADTTIVSFYLTAGASLLMALYALLLPHTPPKAASGARSLSEAMGMDALHLFRRRDFLVFMFCMVLLFIPTQFYFQLGSRYLEDRGYENVAFIMSLGQMSELAFILALPFLLKIFSIRTIIITGAVAWFLRYGFFILGAQEDMGLLNVGAVLLHGICYDFCFITGMLYIDRIVSTEMRAQAQGLFMTMTYGFGMMIGAQVAGLTEVAATGPDMVINWSTLWYTPLFITLAVILLLTGLFKPKTLDTGVRKSCAETA